MRKRIAIFLVGANQIFLLGTLFLAACGSEKGTRHETEYKYVLERPSACATPTDNTLVSNSGRIFDGCDGRLFAAYAPKTSAIDVPIRVFAVGVSNFRSDGPPTLLGSAISARMFTSMFRDIRQTSSKGSFQSYISAPRRNDHTGIFQELDKILVGAEPEDPFANWTPSIFHKYSFQQRKQHNWAQQTRLTKRLLVDSFSKTIAAAKGDNSPKAFVTYISTYRNGDGATARLWASDSHWERPSGFIDIADLVGQHSQLATEQPNTEVFLIIESLGDSKTKGTDFYQQNWAGLPKNLSIIDLRWAIKFPWRWRPEGDGYLVKREITIVDGNVQRIDRTQTELDLTHASRMGPYVVALASTIRWCESYDTQTDAPRSISLQELFSTAIAVVKSAQHVAPDPAPSFHRASKQGPLKIYCRPL